MKTWWMTDVDIVVERPLQFGQTNVWLMIWTAAVIIETNRRIIIREKNKQNLKRPQDVQGIWTFSCVQFSQHILLWSIKSFPVKIKQNMVYLLYSLSVVTSSWLHSQWPHGPCECRILVNLNVCGYLKLPSAYYVRVWVCVHGCFPTCSV